MTAPFSSTEGRPLPGGGLATVQGSSPWCPTHLQHEQHESLRDKMLPYGRVNSNRTSTAVPGTPEVNSNRELSRRCVMQTYRIVHRRRENAGQHQHQRRRTHLAGLCLRLPLALRLARPRRPQSPGGVGHIRRVVSSTAPAEEQVPVSTHERLPAIGERATLSEF